MTTFDDKTTRIDLERQGDHILVEYFDRGWQQGISSPTIYSFAVDTLISKLLFEYQQAGFTVWMADELHGRALRGNITRIDFIQHNGEKHVKKFPYGWTAKTPALSDKVISDAESDQAINWCAEHGWTVYRWPGGARAWNGPVMPIRDASDIRHMRRIINNNRMSGHADERINFNLAFYY
jgi:hypothetical protein